MLGEEQHHKEEEYEHGKPSDGMMCLCTMEDIMNEDQNYGGCCAGSRLFTTTYVGTDRGVRSAILLGGNAVNALRRTSL